MGLLRNPKERLFLPCPSARFPQPQVGFIASIGMAASSSTAVIHKEGVLLFGNTSKWKSPGVIYCFPFHNKKAFSFRMPFVNAAYSKRGGLLLLPLARRTLDWKLSLWGGATPSEMGNVCIQQQLQVDSWTGCSLRFFPTFTILILGQAPAGLPGAPLSSAAAQLVPELRVNPNPNTTHAPIVGRTKWP